MCIRDRVESASIKIAGDQLNEAVVKYLSLIHIFFILIISF